MSREHDSYLKMVISWGPGFENNRILDLQVKPSESKKAETFEEGVEVWAGRLLEIEPTIREAEKAENGFPVMLMISAYCRHCQALGNVQTIAVIGHQEIDEMFANADLSGLPDFSKLLIGIAVLIVRTILTQQESGSLLPDSGYVSLN